MRHVIESLSCLSCLAVAVGQPNQVPVALYDDSDVSARVRAEFVVETTRIFRQAGIELSWSECQVGGKPSRSGECAQSVPSRVMLHLVSRGSKGKPAVTGFAIIQGSNSAYACVYTERVRELAEAAHWDFSDLLAHAAAHEIGHLLLRSAGHTYSGVMRAGWTAEELRGLTHSALIFLPGQLSAIRRGVSVAGFSERQSPHADQRKTDESPASVLSSK